MHSKIANTNNVFERRRLVAEHRRDVATWRQLLPRRPLPGERGFTGVPPVGETRSVSTEMVFQAGPNVSRQSVDDAARRLGLTAIATQPSGITGGTLYHFRVAGGRPVGDVVRSLEGENLGVASPNYVFQLHEETDLAARAAAAVAGGQYVVGKLRLGEVHQVATGSNVLIAVIDSKIDVNHPDVAGAIVEQFDATGRPDQPHTHGTGMVGAIVAHQRLMGIAPEARILAIPAFSGSTRQTEATTRTSQAASNGRSARAPASSMAMRSVHDPMLQLAMKNASAKGVVLIAAAGNSDRIAAALSGRRSARDRGDGDRENDKLFAQVRGLRGGRGAGHVDVMVPAPDTYQNDWHVGRDRACQRRRRPVDRAHPSVDVRPCLRCSPRAPSA